MNNYCSNCGKVISISDVYCSNCGYQIINKKPLTENEKIVVNRDVNNFLVERKFNHSIYKALLFITLIFGIGVHLYFTYGGGEFYLYDLIGLWGSIDQIPFEDRLIYDFHFTWLTYTLPQTILICLIWYIQFGHFKTKSFEKSQNATNKSNKEGFIESPIKPKDGAGIR